MSRLAYWHTDDCVPDQRNAVPRAQVVATGAGITGPTAVGVDAQGDVWLAHHVSASLARFDAGDDFRPTTFDAPGRVYSYSDVSGVLGQVVRSGLRGNDDADYCFENTCGAAQVQYLGPEGGVVAVDTRNGERLGVGSCGGGGGQAVVVVAVDAWSRLDARLHDQDFTGVLQVRADCTDARSEVGCGGGDGPRVELARVPPGTYFIIVDGVDGDEGQASVRVTVEPL